MAEKVGKDVVKTLATKSGNSIKYSDRLTYALTGVPRKLKIVCFVIASAAYIYYLNQDPKKNKLHRKHVFRRIVESIWVPPEGEWTIDKWWKKLTRIPEQLVSNDKWHYMEANYYKPLLNDDTDVCKNKGYSLDGTIYQDLSLYHIMQALRLFGHFDNESTSLIFQQSTIHSIRKGGLLYGIGHKDEYMFVVLQGELDMIFLERLSLLKTVRDGEQIISAFAFVSASQGDPLVYRGLEIRARKDSDVMAIPYVAIFKAMKKDPTKFFTTMRIMMHKALAISFKVINRLLGLNMQLINESAILSSFTDFDLEVGADLTDETRKIAKEGFLDFLGVPREEIDILDDCRMGVYGNGQTITVAGTPGYSDVIYVHYGELYATAKNFISFYVAAGECIGGLTFLSDLKSIFSIDCPKKALIVTVPHLTMERIFHLYPDACLKICHQIVSRLSWYSVMVSLGFEWINLEHKKFLYREGDQAEDIYFLLSGRLRAIVLGNDGQEIERGEITQGDWVGLLEAISNTNRGKSYIASRDSELAKIPTSIIEITRNKFPQVNANILDYISERLCKNYIPSETHDTLVKRTKGSSVPTSVFILPVTENIPITVFALEFIKHHILKYDYVIVTSVKAEVELRSNLDQKSQYELSLWAKKLESSHMLVIYVGDPKLPHWNMRCILQADMVIVLADPLNGSPEMTELEEMMVEYAPLAKKDLVLLYDRSKIPQPRGTRRWLEPRPWIRRHHHIRLPSEAWNFPGFVREDIIQDDYPEWSKPVDAHSDFSRLSRWYAGTSISMIFGGGGAKGAVQIGFLGILLNELRMPVDMVAGVSIGSLISAHMALNNFDIAKLEVDMRKYFKCLNAWWRFFLDAGTFPMALSTGDSFMSGILELLGEIQIEDMWIPYFCVTTNMTGKCARPHYHGNLWEYVRASMNLVGYMEPFRDPIDGHYLMDGGYIQLLPVDFMRNYGAQFVLALDISTGKGVETASYGDSCTGPEAIFNRLFTKCCVPTWWKLQAEITFLQSAFYLQMITKLDMYNIYLKLPSELFSGESFESFDAMMHWGHRHGRAMFKDFEGDTPFTLIWANLLEHSDPFYRPEIAKIKKEFKEKKCIWNTDKFHIPIVENDGEEDKPWILKYYGSN